MADNIGSEAAGLKHRGSNMSSLLSNELLMRALRAPPGRHLHPMFVLMTGCSTHVPTPDHAHIIQAATSPTATPRPIPLLYITEPQETPSNAERVAPPDDRAVHFHGSGVPAEITPVKSPLDGMLLTKSLDGRVPTPAVRQQKVPDTDKENDGDDNAEYKSLTTPPNPVRRLTINNDEGSKEPEEQGCYADRTLTTPTVSGKKHNIHPETNVSVNTDVPSKTSILRTCSMVPERTPAGPVLQLQREFSINQDCLSPHSASSSASCSPLSEGSRKVQFVNGVNPSGHTPLRRRSTANGRRARRSRDLTPFSPRTPRPSQESGKDVPYNDLIDEETMDRRNALAERIRAKNNRL